jgi:hypothetical protein
MKRDLIEVPKAGAPTCDWCDTASIAGLTKRGSRHGAHAGAIIVYACERHRHLLERVTGPPAS